MAQGITEFFQSLEQRPHDPRLDKIQGTVRFDVQDGGRLDHWLVTLEAGRVRVSKEARPDADAVVIADAARLDRAVRGMERAAPSMLRGDLLVRGDWRLLIVMERILPSPPGTRGPHLRRRRT